MQWDWDGAWEGHLLRLNGLSFSVDHRPNVEHHEGAFVVSKTPWLVRDEMEILHPLAPRRILELGTKTGGSAVMWSELLKPGKLVTVDLDDEPLELPGVRTYRGVDQADADALRAIVGSEFDGELDLVLDDASHFFEPTRASFDCLFALLRSGGIYLLEDWDWELQPDFKRPDSWAGIEGLVRLIAELSRRVGDEVRRLSLHRGFAVVQRA